MGQKNSKEARASAEMESVHPKGAVTPVPVSDEKSDESTATTTTGLSAPARGSRSRFLRRRLSASRSSHHHSDAYTSFNCDCRQVLFLGVGDSGKATMFKQLLCLYPLTKKVIVGSAEDGGDSRHSRHSSAWRTRSRSRSRSKSKSRCSAVVRSARSRSTCKRPSKAMSESGKAEGRHRSKTTIAKAKRGKKKKKSKSKCRSKSKALRRRHYTDDEKGKRRSKASLSFSLRKKRKSESCAAASFSSSALPECDEMSSAPMPISVEFDRSSLKCSESKPMTPLTSTLSLTPVCASECMRGRRSRRSALVSKVSTLTKSASVGMGLAKLSSKTAMSAPTSPTGGWRPARSSFGLQMSRPRMNLRISLSATKVGCKRISAASSVSSAISARSISIEDEWSSSGSSPEQRARRRLVDDSVGITLMDDLEMDHHISPELIAASVRPVVMPGMLISASVPFGADCFVEHCLEEGDHVHDDEDRVHHDSVGAETGHVSGDTDTTSDTIDTYMHDICTPLHFETTDMDTTPMGTTPMDTPVTDTDLGLGMALMSTPTLMAVIGVSQDEDVDMSSASLPQTPDPNTGEELDEMREEKKRSTEIYTHGALMMDTRGIDSSEEEEKEKMLVEENELQLAVESKAESVAAATSKYMQRSVSNLLALGDEGFVREALQRLENESPFDFRTQCETALTARSHLITCTATVLSEARLIYRSDPLRYDEFHIETSVQRLISKAMSILSHSSRIASEDGLNFADIPFTELGFAIESLRENESFRHVLRNRFGNFQLTTNADRWFGQCAEMFDPMWNPDRLDWLCSRVRTTGIVKHSTPVPRLDLLEVDLVLVLEFWVREEFGFEELLLSWADLASIITKFVGVMYHTPQCEDRDDCVGTGGLFSARSRSPSCGPCATGLGIHRPLTVSFVLMGSQRNERRKWVHHYANTTSIFYVSSLTQFVETLYEDCDTNSLDEDLELFSRTLDIDQLCWQPVVLFLTKRDILPLVLHSGVSLTNAGDYRSVGSCRWRHLFLPQSRTRSATTTSARRSEGVGHGSGAYRSYGFGSFTTYGFGGFESIGRMSAPRTGLGLSGAALGSQSPLSPPPSESTPAVFADALDSDESSHSEESSVGVSYPQWHGPDYGNARHRLRHGFLAKADSEWLDYCCDKFVDFMISVYRCIGGPRIAAVRVLSAVDSRSFVEAFDEEVRYCVSKEACPMGPRPDTRKPQNTQLTRTMSSPFAFYR